MNTSVVEAVLRIVAHQEKRAVPSRETFGLTPDPSRVFGIAPIRVVSEQRVQALAFGVFGAKPQVVTTWNPLARDSAYLEPFAAALDDYLLTCIDEDVLPRVWLPHT